MIVARGRLSGDAGSLCARWTRRTISSPTAAAAATKATTDGDPSASYPVVIVGAGPTGATLAALLARLGVRSLLLEKSPTPGRAHPAAHFVNTRSMETLRRLPLGIDTTVAGAVESLCPPREQWRRFAYCGSAVGGPLLASVDHFAEGGEESKNRPPPPSPSPVGVAHLPQHRLLPLLLDAVRYASGSGRGGGLVDARFGRDVVGVRPHLPLPSSPPPRPTLEVDFVDAATGELSSALASFVVAADGARSPTRDAVVRSRSTSDDDDKKKRLLSPSGTGPLQHLLSIHFECPSAGRALLEQQQQRNDENLPGAAMLYFVFNSGVAGAVVAHDLNRGEFVLQSPYFPPLQSPGDFPRERVEGLCRAALFGAGGGGGGGEGSDGRGRRRARGLDLVVRDVRPWTMSARVSPRYDASVSSPHPNLFLAGDAAHEFPPAGGLGMNTGIGDAAALAWRLAAALRLSTDGERGESERDLRRLLSSYSTERRGVARAAAALSLGNWTSALAVPRSLGLDDRAAGAASTLASLLADGLSRSPLPRPLARGAAAAALDGVLSAGRAVFGGSGGGGRGDGGDGGATPSAPSAVDRIRASRARGALKRTRGGLRLLFPAYDLGVGYSSCPGAAVVREEGEGGGGRVDEGDDDDDDDDDVDESSWLPLEQPDPPPDAPYVPSTVPGSRMPHAWLRLAPAREGGRGGARGGGRDGATSPSTTAPFLRPPSSSAAPFSRPPPPPWLELPLASSPPSPRRLSTLDLVPAREPSCVLVVRATDSPTSPSPSSVPRWARAFAKLAAAARRRGSGSGGETFSLPLRLAVVARSDAEAVECRRGMRDLEKSGGGAVVDEVAFLVEEGGGARSVFGDDDDGRSAPATSTEAVLVRPDGIVAWRARKGGGEGGGTRGKTSTSTSTTAKGDVDDEFQLLRALRKVYGFSGQPWKDPMPPWEGK